MLANFYMDNMSKHLSLANDSFYLLSLSQFGLLLYALLVTLEDFLTAH